MNEQHDEQCTLHYGGECDCGHDGLGPVAPASCSPFRVRLSRGRGWRKPDNTIVVSRPSFFGNPFKIMRLGERYTVITLVGLRGSVFWGSMGPRPDGPMDAAAARRFAVDSFEGWLNGDMSRTDVILPPNFIERIRTELRGRNLACWCPLDQPCHADVLLRMANDQVEARRQ